MYIATFIALIGFWVLTSCSLFLSEDKKPDIPGKLVFAAEGETGTSQIYTMNANGTGLRQLTHFVGGGAVQPAWSPDGSKIVFANYTEATTLGPYLYIMDADGSNMRPLKRYKGESPKALIGNYPDWSPDGRKIAYSVCSNCEIGGGNYEIVVVKVAGEEYNPEDVYQVTDHPLGGFSPVWSPDGEKIAFISDRINPHDPFVELYLADLKGNNITRITNPGVGGFCWLGEERIIYTISKSDIKQKELLIKNIETNSKNKIRNIQAYSLWLFYNNKNNTSLSIDKKFGELPVNIKVYNLKGNHLLEFKMKDSILKTSLGFDWISPK